MFKRNVVIALLGLATVVVAAPASATITFNGRNASTVTLSTNTSAVLASATVGLTIVCTTGRAGIVPGL
ncbi:MAG TPA: hypothetical protein VI111_06110, partial [Thermoleophilaceae bacterium]